MGTNTGQVMTLANSIIGVSVLAMPYCFKQCGIVLSTLLLCLSSILSRFACHFLLKAAIITRRRNYEFLAFHVFGSKGKLGVELAIIGFLLGTCIAFFVVMGDLGPAIISSMFGLHRSDTLRTSVLLCMAVFVVLPLGLLRNVDSLSSLCTASFAFYLCLVLKVIGEATGPLVAGDWLDQVAFWRPEGLLQCLPIFSMALFCQTQLFEIFDTVPNAALDKLNAVVRVAVNMCTAVYIFVGFFGYVAFFKQNITGNILISLSETMSSEVIKLGFVLSVAVSFPLVIFPCRASLYSLLYRSAQPPVHDIAASHVPEGRFKMLTFSIVGISMVVGLLLPNIERVLGIIGSTIGVTICIIMPSLLLGKTARHPKDRLVSQVIFWSGATVMVLGTYAHILNAGEGVGADPGLEQAANRILDHAVDQLKERPHDAIIFQPLPSDERVKNLLETPVEKILAQRSDDISNQMKAGREVLIDSDRQKLSSVKNEKSVSDPVKPEGNQAKVPALAESNRKSFKVNDEKVPEPAAPADAGEKQQEPPVPVEVVLKHASAEPAQVAPIRSGNVVPIPPKSTNNEVQIKQQQTIQKNRTVVSNAQQVNQDAIRHEDAESALEAKDEKEKNIVVDKAVEKQIELEEQKKKAEEQKLIETLKEHQEVQRDMLNEQQRILQELKKHEKVQQISVDTGMKDIPGVKLRSDLKPLKVRNAFPIDSGDKQRHAESRLPKEEFVGKEVLPLTKHNISAIANDHLQPPVAPIQTEGQANLQKGRNSKYGKAAPIIPLPLAYSAKVSSSSAKVQVLPQSDDSKPGARDILGSNLHHLEKRDVVSVNSVDNDQGAGNGPLVDEDQRHVGILLHGVQDEECKKDSKNIQNTKTHFDDSVVSKSNNAESSPDTRNSVDVNGEQDSPLLKSKNKVNEITNDPLTMKVQRIEAGRSRSKDKVAHVMELKTPSSISEPHVEIESGLNSEIQKIPVGSFPLPTKKYVESVQNKDSQ